MLEHSDLYAIVNLEKEMYLAGDSRHNIIREFLDELGMCECIPWYAEEPNHNEKTQNKRLQKWREQ